MRTKMNLPAHMAMNMTPLEVRWRLWEPDNATGRQHLEAQLAKRPPRGCGLDGLRILGTGQLGNLVSVLKYMSRPFEIPAVFAHMHCALRRARRARHPGTSAVDKVHCRRVAEPPWCRVALLRDIEPATGSETGCSAVRYEAGLVEGNPLLRAAGTRRAMGVGRDSVRASGGRSKGPIDVTEGQLSGINATPEVSHGLEGIHCGDACWKGLQTEERVVGAQEQQVNSAVMNERIVMGTGGCGMNTGENSVTPSGRLRLFGPAIFQ